MKQIKTYEKNGFKLSRHPTYGYFHVNPVPTEKELKEIYIHDYYTEEKPLYIERMQEDLEWWEITYGERYDYFEHYLNSGQKTILDIGSGPGYFLNTGKKRGWDTQGIEPSEKARQHSQSLGLTISSDFFNKESATQFNLFDVIHMSEVLEHIPHPDELLNLCKTKLNKNGLICIVVPNDFNPFHHILEKTCGYEPWWIAPPHHLNYFSFKTLRNLLQGCGFKVVLEEATFPIDMFLLMGKNYIGNDAIGRECHALRKNFELVLHKSGQTKLKQQLYQSFSKLGIGREIMMIGQKET